MKQLDMMGQFEKAGQRRILSVSQIVHQIKTRLETGFRDVWVQGEVSNLRIPPSGHLYFTLKDSDAQIPAVCFRMRRRYLKFQPEDGMELLARGSISVYAPRGQVQLMVNHLEPLGRGALQVAFEQLKEKLSKEGLFDPVHKLKLPLFPAKVGVVTSPSGAAVRDILRVLQERNDRVGVLIYPATVQGSTAPPQIAEGIRELGRRKDVDAIIIARGGGSAEDLWAFNDEALARTIFESRVPVISAVGHETDFTIADFVADVRAATPSAAAETVSAAREELAQRTGHLEKRALQAMALILHKKQERLRILTSSRGFVDAETRLKFFLQRPGRTPGEIPEGAPRVLGAHRHPGGAVDHRPRTSDGPLPEGVEARPGRNRGTPSSLLTVGGPGARLRYNHDRHRTGGPGSRSGSARRTGQGSNRTRQFHGPGARTKVKYREFEGALSRLEKIVGDLEQGDLSLEEALKLFEEGVQVSRYCARVLKEAGAQSGDPDQERGGRPGIGALPGFRAGEGMMQPPAASEADSAEVRSYLRLQQRRVDAKLESVMPPADTYPEVVHEAMRYSLFAGGKRVRPALALATAKALDGEEDTSLQLACALELIHTYSLIHDDLPAMDDDDYRRGLPTSHRKFGEGIAILAGNGLMTLAFQLLAEIPGAAVPDSVRLQVITHLCRAIGASTGLIGGQVMDLVSQGKPYTEEEVQYIHSCKTGALIEASVSTAALLCMAPGSARQRLSAYARHVGLCFQIVDDLLDVEGSQSELGRARRRMSCWRRPPIPPCWASARAMRLRTGWCGRRRAKSPSWVPGPGC